MAIAGGGVFTEISSKIISIWILITYKINKEFILKIASNFDDNLRLSLKKAKRPEPFGSGLREFEQN